MSRNRITNTMLVALLMAPIAASADEEADAMVQAALPVMHHSCASVVEKGHRDEAFVYDVVGKMTAVSLYNRQIDITAFSDSEDDAAQLHAAFVEALEAGCSADENALLAGVVDNAVKVALGL
ncbi:hypothetical protein [Ruegeria hyattellae]|uniref:hypothetical protein n=1 Tax=Ruegeria hyattellae TaxID=3233337 RepID=UPI00355B051C